MTMEYPFSLATTTTPPAAGLSITDRAALFRFFGLEGVPQTTQDIQRSVLLGFLAQHLHPERHAEFRQLLLHGPGARSA